jgi:hypothetical protein
MGIFHHAVRADFAVITDDAVFDHAAGANFDAIAQHHVAFQDNVSINLNIAPVRSVPRRSKRAGSRSITPASSSFSACSD